MDDDIEAGNNLGVKPKEIYETRDEYKLSKPNIFQCHIEQSISTAKYNHTLKVKAYSKLKKTMVNMISVMWMWMKYKINIVTLSH